MFITDPPLARPTMNRATDDPRPAFTARHGQYLAFIHTYTLVNGRPPAEADMMRFFRVTPRSVHQMVLTLEQTGLISRKPGVPRSIAVLIDRSHLPELQPATVQPVKTNVTRY
jgi:SOS-response transcriptional repressor LexA